MWKIVSFLSISLLLIAEDLEVRLVTRSSAKPIYVCGFDGLDELKSVLEYDFNLSGFCSVAPKSDTLDRSLRERFDQSLWKREKIPFCVVGSVVQDRLAVVVYDVERGSSKKYGPVNVDRGQIHKMADAIQKDLFGVEGIASLKLIYTQRTKNGTVKGLDWLSEVWISDFDGANAKQLTSEKSYCLSPYFLGGNEFLYVCEKSGQSKIYRASLNGAKSELLVDLRGNQALPAIARNNTQIAFITDIAGRPDLFVQGLGKSGKARQLFSSPRATQATPTFSPDGKQIAFVSDKDGPPRIYVLDTNGKSGQKPRLLTRKNRENTSPSWSPDGSKLAYSAKVDGVRQIWIYDFGKDEEVALTTGAENKENPNWAPDSFHLVYNTESEESCELYLAHLNGADPVCIGKGNGQKRFASWQMR